MKLLREISKEVYRVLKLAEPVFITMMVLLMLDIQQSNIYIIYYCIAVVSIATVEVGFKIFTKEDD